MLFLRAGTGAAYLNVIKRATNSKGNTQEIEPGFACFTFARKKE